jgi:hypothetical protein
MTDAAVACWLIIATVACWALLLGVGYVLIDVALGWPS